MTRIKIRSPLFLLALLLFTSSTVFGEQKNDYHFGVFPYLPPTKLQALFTPIADSFGEALGRPVNISSKPSYKQFRKGLEEELYDIAFVQPFDYVLAHDRHNYLPLARRGGMLRAILIVTKESPLQKFSELKGKVVANPPAVAAVSQLTSMALLEAGIDPEQGVTRAYSKGHFSCMQRVLIGSADACGTAIQALAHFEEKQMEERFRILHQSQPIPQSLFVVHRRVPEAERQRLLETILGWTGSESGKAILANGHFIPFMTANDDDYQSVRSFWRQRDGR